MKKILFFSLLLATAIGASAAGWSQVNLNKQASAVKISETINAMVVHNDTLFAATADGVWASPSGFGGDWVAFGLQGENVRLLNFKVKKLAIVATTGNFQPLYELAGGVWVRNTTLPVDAAITGGVNFEQKLNADLSHSIVIPTGSTSSGRIYTSIDGGATFTSAIPGNAFVSVGVNTFDGDPNFYFPNSAKVGSSLEANNNQTSFYFSANKGVSFARVAVSYSIATGIPANFIFKLASTQNPGHTYHFLGGQKDVVRVDSLGVNTAGAPISWNNPANMKSFITNRTVAITDGATNLTTFPTYNFKKMLVGADSKLYLLSDKTLQVSTDEGATYTQVFQVAGDTVLTSMQVKGNYLMIGSNHGVLTNFNPAKEKVNALVLQNDTLFAAGANGIWASKDKGASWFAFGLQGQEVRLINFKVKKLAIVATTGNFQPLYELVDGVWVRNTTLPVDVAITGGVNFEQMLNADLTHSIVIPTGSTSSGRIYTSANGGATFSAVTPGNAFVSVGINTFAGDPNFYFPNSAKAGSSLEANNNQTSFYFSSNKGATFARVANSYSIATGIPANFIFKLASTQNPGHTYHFLGGQKDVVRVDSLGLTHPGVIPWNNPANMKSFITNRTVAITDGATNLTTFPTYNFRKMMATDASLYLLADKALYLSKDEGATYRTELAVSGDTVMTAVVATSDDVLVGSNKGILTLAVDNLTTGTISSNDQLKIQVVAGKNTIRIAAEGVYNVSIYNLTGQLVSRLNNQQAEISVPVSGNQSVYLVKVETALKSTVVKVLLP